ncbi:MAG: IS1182 family transposase [Lamprocystis purpurea]|nr:IS1182 family transposase [Lamprocystis purpurea]
MLQFVENLSDRAAADAVRGRLDWKYLLGLELTDPGFDHTVLSEFRARLTTGQAEQRLLDTLLVQLQEMGLLKARGRQRTDSTHILAAVRTLNRLERVGETLRAALNAVASVVPDWLCTIAPSAWYERYGHRIENYRLPPGKEARDGLAAEIGSDGHVLLDAIDAAPAQAWLNNLPAIQTLRQVWEQQYCLRDGALAWRPGHELSALAERIESPYDPQARYSTKRSVDWVGYKVHFTETCDPGTAHVIVNVETTVASVPDAHLLTTVHASLVRRELLPAEHLVDMGYTSPRVLVESARRDGVRIVGPIAEDTSWQARADNGFAKADFHIDWDAQIVACPAGHQSSAWVPKTGVPGIVAEARFSPQDCVPCPHREDCTKSKKAFRVIPLQPQDQYEALQNARLAQTTEPFRDAYAARAGVESTHEQAVRRCGLRRCRYIGLAKTRLQHVVTAVAVNLIRIGDWLTGTPLAPTRRSRFVALQAAA